MLGVHALVYSDTSTLTPIYISMCLCVRVCVCVYMCQWVSLGYSSLLLLCWWPALFVYVYVYLPCFLLLLCLDYLFAEPCNDISMLLGFVLPTSYMLLYTRMWPVATSDELLFIYLLPVTTSEDVMVFEVICSLNILFVSKVAWFLCIHYICEVNKYSNIRGHFALYFF